jgi:hypothetical protein
MEFPLNHFDIKAMTKDNGHSYPGPHPPDEA